MHYTLPDSIDSLIIVPDASLVELNHDVQGPLGSILVRVLQQAEHEALQLFIDQVVLGALVNVL